MMSVAELKTILCPGLCTCWPCEYIVVTTPRTGGYVCPSGFFTEIFGGVAGNVVLRLGGCPPELSALGGKCWHTRQTVTAGPGTEGDTFFDYTVICRNENLSYPELHFRYEDHNRPTGNPDPNVVVCFHGCFTEIFCECLKPIKQHEDRVGFTHGLAKLACPDVTNEECRCTFQCSDSTDFWQVACLCTGTGCDCYGVPKHFSCHFECDGLCQPRPGHDCSPTNQAQCEANGCTWLPGLGSFTFGMDFYDVGSIPDWTGQADSAFPLWAGREDIPGTDCYVVCTRACTPFGAFVTFGIGTDNPMSTCVADLTTSRFFCFCTGSLGARNVQCFPFHEGWSCNGAGTDYLTFDE